jgi:hypothetical protein
MAAKPKFTDDEIRAARRWVADGMSLRAAAKKLGYGTDGHKALSNRIARQERAEQEAHVESDRRYRQRQRDRAQASRQGQPWNPDALTPAEATAAVIEAGADPVPSPDHVPRELPEAHRRPRAPRPSGRPAQAQPATQIRRLPDGTMSPPGAPELPPGFTIGTVLTPDAFGRRITQERFKWLLSCAAAEGRLLEDPRYPGQGRYGQTVLGDIRCFVWLGNPADLDTFSRYASANYVPPAGMATGRILVLDDSGEPNQETLADWQARNRRDAQEYADRDLSRWAVVDPTGHAVVTKTSRAAADEALARHQARFDVPLHLEEVTR